MSRIALIILGILVAAMGVLALIPSITLGSEPLWHSIVKIALGVIAIIIGAADKKKA